MEKIIVSIICTAYNHEPYIEKALKSFLFQQTNFAYEVIVHDDASTDKTQEIIKEYAAKYPDIIKPILQTENQHSKGINNIRNFIWPCIRGKYVAICEGDDCWTDENKLQRQVDFLESNLEYSACAHRTLIKETFSGLDRLSPRIRCDKDYSVEEVILNGGSVFATCSFMIRTSIYLQLPKCFYAKNFGDYQLFIYAAAEGKVRCLYQPMAQYNHETNGSWSVRVGRNKDRLIAHFSELISVLKSIDEYYQLKYHRAIETMITVCEVNIAIYKNDFSTLRQKEYLKVYRRILFQKARHQMMVCFSKMLFGKKIWNFVAKKMNLL